jgi:tRNA dimethylallyltransferase
VLLYQNMFSNYNLIVILGPTASNKTGLAAHLASKIHGEIISADSRQVYRRLNLGTGKDYEDYNVDGNTIPYHLIDIAEPGSQYNVYEFQKDFIRVFENLKQRNKIPLLCGGSGLYIEAVIQGFKLIHVPVNESLRESLEQKTLEDLIQILGAFKILHNTSDIDNKKRAVRAIEIETYYQSHPEIDFSYPELKPLLIGVKFDRVSQRNRITERLTYRLKNGMIDEVENLLKDGITPDQLIYYGLEYKFLTQYVTGKITYDEMFRCLNTAIHQFAKRQMTWFRRMENQGMNICWLDGYLPMDEKIERILSIADK